MDLKEFQELSVRTAPFNAAPSNFIEYQNILGNYSMGLVGEYFEYLVALDNYDVNMKESSINEIFKEAGDVLHYAVNLLTIMEHDIDLKKLNSIGPQNLEKHLANILEIPKKHIYHGHKMNKKDFIDSIYVIIASLNGSYPLKFSEILKMNIDKLKKRYPEKFTSEASIARVDEK